MDIFLCAEKERHKIIYGSKTVVKTMDIFYWVSVEKKHKKNCRPRYGNNISVFNIIYSTIILFFF